MELKFQLPITELKYGEKGISMLIDVWNKRYTVLKLNKMEEKS